MLLFSRSSCLLSGPHSWALGRKFPHLPASDIVSSGCYRDEGRGVTPPCQKLCFWGPPWMSQVRPFCPDVLHRWESERRNERDEASSWGHILAQMCQDGAELIAGRHWRLSHTFMHGDREASGREHWAAWISAWRRTEAPAHIWEDGVWSRGESTASSPEEGGAALLGGPEEGEFNANPGFNRPKLLLLN